MQVTINIPETIKLSKNDLLMRLAGNLYESKILSLGQAAKLAGISKLNFIENLGLYGFSVFNFSEDDLDLDFQNLENINENRNNN